MSVAFNQRMLQRAILSLCFVTICSSVAHASRGPLCRVVMGGVPGPIELVRRWMESPDPRAQHENISKVAIVKPENLAAEMHVSIQQTHSPRYLAGTVVKVDRVSGEAVILDETSLRQVEVRLERIQDIRFRSQPIRFAQASPGTRVAIRQNEAPGYFMGVVVGMNSLSGRMIVLGETSRKIAVFTRQELALGLGRQSPRANHETIETQESVVARAFEASGYEGERSPIHVWRSREMPPSQMLESLRSSVDALDGAHAIDQVVISVADGITYGARGPHIIRIEGRESVLKMKVSAQGIAIPDMGIDVPANQLRGLLLSVKH